MIKVVIIKLVEVKISNGVWTSGRSAGGSIQDADHQIC